MWQPRLQFPRVTSQVTSNRHPDQLTNHGLHENLFGGLDIACISLPVHLSLLA